MTAEAVNRNLATVGAIYEAFGRGDGAAAASAFADDVEWEYAFRGSPAPWLKPGRGREHAEWFFQALHEHLAIESFGVNHLLANDDVVVCLFNIAGVVRATGKRIAEVDEAHIFHFNGNGKVSRFRHAADTHQHWLASQA